MFRYDAKYPRIFLGLWPSGTDRSLIKYFALYSGPAVSHPRVEYLVIGTATGLDR